MLTNILKLKKVPLINKNSINDVNIISFNNKQIINFINYYNYLKQALKLKNVYIDTISFSQLNKNITITITLYFNALRLLLLKKKVNFKNIKTNYSHFSKNYIIPKHFLKYNKLNSLTLNCININKQINIQKSLTLYAILKNSISSLLKKKRYLLIDFIRIITLLIENKISAKLFSLSIGQIFATLSKKSHNRFFLILKKIFKTIILDNKIPKSMSKIEGIKFKISGRIRGKTRADTRNITVGSVPLQTDAKHIEFFKQHVYTVYGAFGLKLWVYRNPQALITKAS